MAKETIQNNIFYISTHIALQYNDCLFTPPHKTDRRTDRHAAGRQVGRQTDM